MPDLAEVLRSVLSLNVDDRAALAERLLASLDELDEEEAERLWAEEARRRLQEYRGGALGLRRLKTLRRRQKDSSGDSRQISSGGRRRTPERDRIPRAPRPRPRATLVR